MEAIELLRTWREDCHRDPEAVRDLWVRFDEIESLLSVEEKWTVIEQFCMAAIDLHDESIYSVCLNKLNNQFPGSNRVKILNIMSDFELPGCYDEAIRHYNDMIDDDETNSAPRKRKIAILIGQKRNVEAIRELCDHLRKFMNDLDAWKELCDLYIQELDYPRAIFCMEELLLSHPLSHIYHTRIAEMYYTIGNFESFELAKQYFHQAVKLNENNVRALLGLNLSLKNLLATNKLTSQVRKEYEQLAIATKKAINHAYDTTGNPEVSSYMKLN